MFANLCCSFNYELFLSIGDILNFISVFTYAGRGKRLANSFSVITLLRAMPVTFFSFWWWFFYVLLVLSFFILLLMEVSTFGYLSTHSMNRH